MEGVKKSSDSTPTQYRTMDSFLDLLRNMFPNNIVSACFISHKTRYSSTPGKYNSYNTTSITTLPNAKTTINVFNNGTHNITMVTREVYAPSINVPDGTKSSPGVNVIGITAFCIVFGVVLAQLKEKGLPLAHLFSSLNDAVMKIVTLIMWFSPIGIFSLVCTKVAQMDDVLLTLQIIGLFVVTVLSATAIHGIIVLPLLYFLMTKMNPFKFMVGMGDALATAFSISSRHPKSSATLPTTIRCVEENKYNKVDSRIASFMLPLGATVNMDGSAVFEAVVGVFVAQLNNVETTPAFMFTNV
ncbi:hypothetical protein QZH41_008877 [Actinostola sp. cb2023]|nr:hypothetical protein QZH41_008877 [Actinostola sp. cb2023]